jgi:hypothetical protein
MKIWPIYDNDKKSSLPRERKNNSALLSVIIEWTFWIQRFFSRRGISLRNWKGGGICKRRTLYQKMLGDIEHEQVSNSRTYSQPDHCVQRFWAFQEKTGRYFASTSPNFDFSKRGGEFGHLEEKTEMTLTPVHCIKTSVRPPTTLTIQKVIWS